jgi:hypothetical protein
VDSAAGADNAAEAVVAVTDGKTVVSG